MYKTEKEKKENTGRLTEMSRLHIYLHTFQNNA